MELNKDKLVNAVNKVDFKSRGISCPYCGKCELVYKGITKHGEAIVQCSCGGELTDVEDDVIEKKHKGEIR